MNFDYLPIQKHSNLNRLLVNQNGDLILQSILKTTLICQDLLESILTTQLNMTYEALFIAKRLLLIQNTDLELVYLKEDPLHQNLSVQVQPDLKLVKCHNETLITDLIQIYQNDLSNNNPLERVILKSDQEDILGKCHHHQASKRMRWLQAIFKIHYETLLTKNHPRKSLIGMTELDYQSQL